MKVMPTLLAFRLPLLITKLPITQAKIRGN